MEFCRRAIFLSFLFYLCFGMFGQNSSIRAEPSGGKKTKKIVFQWAFCTLRKTDADQKPRIVGRKTTMNSGDQIKFFVKPQSACYLYLIHHTSRQQLKMLYPLRLNPAVSQNAGSGGHYIPDGSHWFKLDENTGQEKFYLLASVWPLTELENFIRLYEGADKVNRSGLADQIIAEIRNLRKRHLKFKTYSEKPVANFGKQRGGEQSVSGHTKDIAHYAVEISTTTFFSRTYTIDHREE